MRTSRPLRVLLVHNRYRQRGGEDAVFEQEAEMLRRRGHQVSGFEVDNRSLEGQPGLGVALRSIWNNRMRDRLCRIVATRGIDVAHFHNILPQLSPAAVVGAHEAGAATVMTLHNYRMLCPGALLYRDGSTCESCIGRRLALPGIRNRCYRGSRAASACVAIGQMLHRSAGTWHGSVDRFIALTEFARERFIRGDLPADRIAVKPNTVDWRPARPPLGPRGDVLFVGRLTEEKGIRALLQAAAELPVGVRVRVVGDGPLAAEVKQADGGDRIVFLGSLAPEAVRCEMEHAALLVAPSQWYEGMPMTILEAFRTGLPVVASRIGPLPDLVREGREGRLFAPADGTDLARVVAETLSDTTSLKRMGQEARARYEREFSPTQVTRQLESIYGDAIARRAETARGMSA